MTVSFTEHVALLGAFLDHRIAIADQIERRLLNVRDANRSRFRDRRYVEQLLDACFFAQPGLPPDSSRLRGQLAATHLADGFEPVLIDRFVHELDPLELAVRAHSSWDAHRWPGRNGRLAYAHTLFSAALMRELQHLSLRVWDEGNDRAGDRLKDVQRLLDRLNAHSPQDVLIRDARWLIHTAQGPLTLHLGPYFKVAVHIAASFTAAERIELHKAGARLTGGHLRSQLRYRMWETHQPVDAPDILAVTRNSNSMDVALLVGDLVALLEAYDRARQDEDTGKRLDLADALLQGFSADPELLLARLDLLAPCTMIEDLFVAQDNEGPPRYTALGERQVELLARYGTLLGHLAHALMEDARVLDPAHHAYSPFGITYGFAADLLSNIAQSRLTLQPSHGLSLEDTFVSRQRVEDKLARARGWQTLPTGEGERAHFEHSVEWAGQMFGRMMDALDARARQPTAVNASGLASARLFVAPTSGPLEQLFEGPVPPGVASAGDYCVTSNLTRASATGPMPAATSAILSDRREGRFLASWEAGGQWFAISKVLLTTLISRGVDALISDVPLPAIEVLRLTCPGLVVVL